MTFLQLTTLLLIQAIIFFSGIIISKKTVEELIPGKKYFLIARSVALSLLIITIKGFTTISIIISLIAGLFLLAIRFKSLEKIMSSLLFLAITMIYSITKNPLEYSVMASTLLILQAGYWSSINHDLVEKQGLGKIIRRIIIKDYFLTAIIIGLLFYGAISL